MDYKTEELMKKNPFQYSESLKQSEGEFFECLMEELCFHYENNDMYRKFCIRKGFDPRCFRGEISEIPSVQVSVFKELGRQLVSVPKEQIKLTLQSSATSGIPSSVLVDKVTSKRQGKAMIQVIGDYIGYERKPFLIMDVDPAEGFRELLGARYAAVSGYLKFASKAGYFLKVNSDNQYYFDEKGIQSFLSELKENEPVIVFGFTYILYSNVIKPLLDRGVTFQLPKDSRVIHIGGWKKLESEKVSREEFDLKAAQLFGLKSDSIIDIYGFTEQMGLNYPTCACGCKHTPAYSEVIVRDIMTKEVLPAGKEGLMEFITPVPHSYPGNVVLTDDIGIIENGECPYGRSGTRFRIIGRLKKAEARGCGDILASKLTFAGGEKKAVSMMDLQYKVDYFYDLKRLDGLEPKDSLVKIIEEISNQLDWIRRQPVDALIGLIAQVARKWADERIGETLKNGLSFLMSWCSAEHLTTILTEGLNGNRMYVDTFLPNSEDCIQYRKAVSRGVCCHWLAGNVQVLGMFVLIESILTKNVNVLKVSSKDSGVFTKLLRKFENEVYTTPGGYTIAGNDLLKTIAVVYYSHSNETLGKVMSEKADIRVAWGGAAAVTSVANYPMKYDCENLIMGPKLSLAVVSKEAINDEHKAKKLGRKIGIDASVFDQTGCASVHNVYVEEGAEITPKEFAGYIAEGMRKTALQIPKSPSSLEQVSAVHSVRGVYDFKGCVYGDAETTWTVLYDPEEKLCDPIYSRVVFVHPVKEIKDVVKYINENIQTVGMAADGEKALEFAAAAADKGAMRFPICGRMLNFDSPWDGMYLTDRMVRWVTIGGPGV